MNEQFSALVDGELDGKEGDALLARLKADTELQDGWDHYHLIGDAMRQNRQLDIDITAAVRARLADEPTVLAPAALPRPASRARRASRWVGYAMAASAALVAVIVGVQSDNLSEDAQLASVVLSTPAPEAVQTLAMAPTAPEAPANNPYMLAHQESVSNPHLMTASYSSEGRR